MFAKLDYDLSKGQGILDSDLLDLIREKFSVKDEALSFAKKRRPFAAKYLPERKYVITKKGRFKPRLWPLIIAEIKAITKRTDFIEITDSFKERVINAPKRFNREELVSLKLDPRDYQEESLLEAGKNGGGVIVLPTSAGKTLVIAMLAETYAKLTNKKVLILVPDIQLVAQTYSDLVSYGLPEGYVTKWTGNIDPNESAQIWIANQQIFLNRADFWCLRNNQFDTFICDECHKLRDGNKINKALETLHAKNRFGFTGSFPEPLLDQWAIIGLLGPIIYQQKSIDLRDQKYITPVQVAVLELEYTQTPVFEEPTLQNPTAGYEDEIQFLHTNGFRNQLIAKIVNKLDKNVLILVDRIAHGEELHKILSENLDGRNVHFIQGSMEVDDREVIRKSMEEHNKVVCVAISKIFSTGLNIKNLHYIVFAAIGKARIKIIQSIGRSLRLHHSKDTAIIFDLGDMLRYGRRHLTERLDIYHKEDIPVAYTKRIIEPHPLC